MFWDFIALLEHLSQQKLFQQLSVAVSAATGQLSVQMDRLISRKKDHRFVVSGGT